MLWRRLYCRVRCFLTISFATIAATRLLYFHCRKPVSVRSKRTLRTGHQRTGSGSPIMVLGEVGKETDRKRSLRSRHFFRSLHLYRWISSPCGRSWNRQATRFPMLVDAAHHSHQVIKRILHITRGETSVAAISLTICEVLILAVYIHGDETFLWFCLPEQTGMTCTSTIIVIVFVLIISFSFVLKRYNDIAKIENYSDWT